LFEHLNVNVDDAPDVVRYDFQFQTNGAPSNLSLQMVYTHQETPNSGCAPLPSCTDDKVTIVPTLVAQVYSQGPDQYLFELLGLSSNGGVTFPTQFISPEGTTNAAHLYGRITSTNTVVPEPATMILFGSGLMALVAHRRRRRDS
jgi:hypothetical protein